MNKFYTFWGHTWKITHSVIVTVFTSVNFYSLSEYKKCEQMHLFIFVLYKTQPKNSSTYL